MGLLDDMADDLAQQTMQIIAATGDLDIEREMAAILGTSSQTLEEAYLTAMRVRKAEKRARELLATKRKAAGLDRPTHQRKRAVGDGLEEVGLQEELLDIPAFLRRQAD